MSDERRVVASGGCPVRRELLFHNWQWSVREHTPEEGCVADYPVTPNQAAAYFEQYFKDDHEFPLELAFHVEHPDPFLIYDAGKAMQFNPKGWTLYGAENIERDFNGEFFQIQGTAWLFGANGRWIEVEFSAHMEADYASDPTFHFVTKQQAADTLICNGYALPDELAGHATIAVLTPDYDPPTESNEQPQAEFPPESVDREWNNRTSETVAAMTRPPGGEAGDWLGVFTLRSVPYALTNAGKRCRIVDTVPSHLEAYSDGRIWRFTCSNEPIENFPSAHQYLVSEAKRWLDIPRRQSGPTKDQWKLVKYLTDHGGRAKPADLSSGCGFDYDDPRDGCRKLVRRTNDRLQRSGQLWRLAPEDRGDVAIVSTAEDAANIP